MWLVKLSWPEAAAATTISPWLAVGVDSSILTKGESTLSSEDEEEEADGEDEVEVFVASSSAGDGACSLDDGDRGRFR